MKIYAQPPNKARERWLIGELDEDRIAELSSKEIVKAVYPGISPESIIYGRVINSERLGKHYLVVLI